MNTSGALFYVSLQGKDTWSGRLPEPNEDHTDGPFASVDRGREEVRNLRRQAVIGGPATVQIRGGRYRLNTPLRFAPEDSGPTTFEAFPGETPVFDGGVPVTGWAETTVNGVTAWKADVGDILRTHGPFRSLYVDGKVRPRSRYPKDGFLWIADAPCLDPDGDREADLFKGSDRFRAAPGDLKDWKNPTDIDIIVLHYWIDEHMPVESLDPESGWVQSTRRSTFVLRDDVRPTGAKYFVENVFEEMTSPGEWYLDVPEQTLYYIPCAGETPEKTTITAPVCLQLVRFEGDRDGGRAVEGITLSGLHFEHTDWVLAEGWGTWFDPEIPRQDRPLRDAYLSVGERLEAGVAYAAAPQGAFDLPGIVHMTFAQDCAIEDCRIALGGWYGIDMGEGCFDNRVVGTTMADLGAGAIKLDGGHYGSPLHRRNGNHRLTDNHCHHLGHVFRSACGILLMHSFGNEVSHNTVHDLYYTGISTGWTWGYGPSVARENRIEKNHIYNLGQGVLSDMGGIYVLGIQPGTALRGNVIHDIHKANYGGWAIYTDEGCSHLVIENNIAYRTSSQPFHQHIGRENHLRNNIWAFGSEGQIGLSRGNSCGRGYAHRGVNTHCAFAFERNIVITDGEPVFVGGLTDATGNLEHRNFHSDLNLIWDISGGPAVSGNADIEQHGVENLKRAFDWDAWQALGYDLHSVVADPKCADPKNGDFTLAADSPALALGFRPIDTSDVGPRSRSARA